MFCKDLYVLNTSGYQFHENLSENLRKLVYFPSKSDPGIWINYTKYHYVYIVTYCENVLICNKDTMSLVPIMPDPDIFLVPIRKNATTVFGSSYLDVCHTPPLVDFNAELLVTLRKAG